MNYLTFNGVSSLDKGIRIWSSPNEGLPEKSYNKIQIPGRDGDVIVDYGRLANMDINYKISVFSLFNDVNWDYDLAFQRLKEWLDVGPGYHKLVDSRDPNVYRMAYVKGSTGLENILNEVGVGNVKFSCKPEKWYNETTWETINLTLQTGSGTISTGSYNNTQWLYDSPPTLWLEGVNPTLAGETPLCGELEITATDFPDQKIIISRNSVLQSTSQIAKGIIFDSLTMNTTGLDGKMFIDGVSAGSYIGINSEYVKFYAGKTMNFKWTSYEDRDHPTLVLKVKPNHWKL